MSGKTERGVQHRQASAVASIAGAVPALAAGFVASGSAGGQPGRNPHLAGTLSGEAWLLGSLKLGWEETGRNIWLHADAGQLRQKGALAAGEKRRAAASSFGLGSALALGEQISLLAAASRQWQHSTQRPARADTRFYLSLAWRLGN